MTYKIFGEGEK